MNFYEVDFLDEYEPPFTEATQDQEDPITADNSAGIPSTDTTQEEPLKPDKPTQKRKRGRPHTKRTQFFTDSDKKVLIAEVKKRPVLWDLSHRDHANTNATDRAWKDIAKELSITGSECKTAWIALRESHRYRQKTMYKKSGSGGGVPLPEQSCNEKIDWEIADDLDFLPEKTYTTDGMPNQQMVGGVVEGTETRTDTEDRADETDRSFGVTSNYSYQIRPSDRSKAKINDDEEVNELTTGLNRLIDLQMSTAESMAQSRNEQPLVPRLTHHICFEMTSLIMERIRANHRLI